MATLHLMIGLPCSGKTTFAKQLEEDLNAIRFTPDEWQLQLFGQDAEHPEHDKRHSTIEEIQWGMAAKLLYKDVDVILDFGLWSRVERDEFRARAHTLNAKTQLHFLNVPHETLFERLEKRNKQVRVSNESFYIPPDMLKEWLPLFEAPNDEELALNHET